MSEWSAGDRKDLSRVYWIGGSPCAGKSSVTRVLARRYGLWTWYCDWHQLAHERHRAQSMDGFPALAAWNRKSAEEQWLSTPPEQPASASGVIAPEPIDTAISPSSRIVCCAVEG